MNSRQAINLLKDLEQSLDDYCELNDEGKAAFRMAITALELFGNAEQLPSAQPEIRTQMSSANCISRQAALDCVTYDVEYTTERIKALPSLQPTCNQLATDCISRQAAIDAFMTATSDGDKAEWCRWVLKQLPSAQPEWNNHTVACMLAELFDDTCACNYNGIDEWLPEKCELLDSCPNPAGVACWEQYLKHRAERRIDG